jgi:hypothetical protein
MLYGSQAGGGPPLSTPSLLHEAVVEGDLGTVKHLLLVCTDIYTMQGSCFPSSLPLILLAASEGQYSILSWAIDHGGADMTTVSGDGRTVWDHLRLPPHPDSDTKNRALWCASQRRALRLRRESFTVLLKTMVQHSDPPLWLVSTMAAEDAQVTIDGGRLRKKVAAKEASDEEEEDSDSDTPLAAPPALSEDLKGRIKEILEGAELTQLSVKKVRNQLAETFDAKVVSAAKEEIKAFISDCVAAKQ